MTNMTRLGWVKYGVNGLGNREQIILSVEVTIDVSIEMLKGIF